MSSTNSPYVLFCFLIRAILPSTQSNISHRLISVTVVTMVTGGEIMKPAQAARTNAIDNTEIALGLKPKLMNKYSLRKGTFRTHNFTHHELLEFFLVGSDSTILLRVYLIYSIYLQRRY